MDESEMKRTMILVPANAKTPTQRILNASTRANGLPPKCPEALAPYFEFLQFLDSPDAETVPDELRIQHEQHTIYFHRHVHPERLKSLHYSSVKGALLARLLSGMITNVQLDPTKSFSCGLFQDIGRLVIDLALYSSEPTKIDQIRQRVEDGLPLNDAEYDALGTDHGYVGAKLLESWNAPKWLCDCLRNHNQPDLDLEPYPALTHLVGRLQGNISLPDPASKVDDRVLSYFNLTPEFVNSFVRSYRGYQSIFRFACAVETGMVPVYSHQR